VTVSPKFQIVIPKAIREALNIKSGQKIRVIRCQDRIELVPIKPIKAARGFLQGIDITVERDEDQA
jgi:AbrB family looped-hinge helix DNA binding protein